MVLSQFSHQQRKIPSNITKTVKSHTGIPPHFLYASCTLEKRKPCEQTPHQRFIPAKQFFCYPPVCAYLLNIRICKNKPQNNPSLNYPSGNQIILLQTAAIKRKYCLIPQILPSAFIEDPVGEEFLHSLVRIMFVNVTCDCTLCRFT